MRLAILWLGLLALGSCGLAGCDRAGVDESSVAGRPRGARERPPTHVDSALSREEHLRRFTAGLADRPTRLSGGRSSVEALVRDYLSATARGDTAALRAMHLSRAEFAFLYYDTDVRSRPPYALPPGLLWFQLEMTSLQGSRRLSAFLRAGAIEVLGVECPHPPEAQGPNRLHRDCIVAYRRNGREARHTGLVGPIIERDGHFKFLTFANRL